MAEILSSPLSSPPTSPIKGPCTRGVLTPKTPHRIRPRSTSDCTQSTPRACTVLNVTPSHKSQQGLPPVLSPLHLSPGFILAPPIHGTVEEKKAIRLKEVQAKRADTLTQKYAALEQEWLAKADKEHAIHQETFHHCLELLRTRGSTFGEFVMYVLNPNLGLGTARWHNFAIIPGRVRSSTGGTAPRIPKVFAMSSMNGRSSMCAPI